MEMDILPIVFTFSCSFIGKRKGKKHVFMNLLGKWLEIHSPGLSHLLSVV